MYAQQSRQGFSHGSVIVHYVSISVSLHDPCLAAFREGRTNVRAPVDLDQRVLLPAEALLWTI
jgi:hypothetical protein